MTGTTNYFRATVLIPTRPRAQRKRPRESCLLCCAQVPTFLSSAPDPRPKHRSGGRSRLFRMSLPQRCHRRAGKSVNLCCGRLLKWRFGKWERRTHMGRQSKSKMTAFACGCRPTLQCGWLARHTVCGPVGVDWEYN